VQNPVLFSALDRPAFDRTQLCLFVPQTTGVEATSFLSRMQNLVKIREELWT